MFTIIRVLQPTNAAYDDEHKNLVVVEAACLSTDEKPLGFANGSKAFEMDTSKTYRFNYDTKEWVETTEGGGGGGGGTGIKVGIVTNGSSFPTARPDSSSLQAGDYVTVSNSSTFPFTIGTCTFNSSRDKGVYNGSGWEVEAGIAQDTDETPLSDVETESIDQDATTQQDVNVQFVDNYKDIFLNTKFEDLDTLEEENILKRVYKQTTDTEARKTGYYIYNFDTHKWEPFGMSDAGETTNFEFNFTDGTTANYKLLNGDE